MDCLDEETILGFCRGELAPDVHAEAQEHVSRCDECRQLVSALARSSIVVPEDEGSDRNAGEPGPLLRERLDPAMAATMPLRVGPAARQAASASPVRAGEILAGKFEVERVLGAGGMGIVVAARHMQLGQRVALKFLLPAACEVPGAVARFLREGKAAARITSEHVARVMDTGLLAAGAPYLVMEYLEGSDLGAVVQQRGRLPADEAIEYVLQACEAIVEAHELGIVHRDLKPANLFLSERADGSPLVKVLDFGISKVDGSGSRSQVTSASMLMGSPRYMSPEQMLSAKDVDARTDVWALGVILYELTTGKAVWEADTMPGLCAQIASAPAPRLRATLPDASPVLEDVVARCLMKDVEQRISGVAALAEALSPIAPAVARTSIDRIVRLARRERVVRAPLRIAPLAPLPEAPTGGAVVASEPPRPRATGRVSMMIAIAAALAVICAIVVVARLSSSVANAPEPLAPATTSTPAPVRDEPRAPLPTREAAAPDAAVTDAGVTDAEAAEIASARPPVPKPAPRTRTGTVAVAGAPDASVAAKVPLPPGSNRALTDRK